MKFSLKKILSIIIAIIIVYIFYTSPNKNQFLYGTVLGRAILLSLIISLTYYNKLAGLLAVIILSFFYNHSVFENMESSTDTSSTPTTTNTTTPTTTSTTTPTPTIAPLDMKLPDLDSNMISSLNEKIKKITDTISSKQSTTSTSTSVPTPQTTDTPSTTTSTTTTSEGFTGMVSKNNRLDILSAEQYIRPKQSNSLPFSLKKNSEPSSNWPDLSGYQSLYASV